MRFAHYVALGDSVSNDLYPALDSGATDVAVALERERRAGQVAPLGAASLLHRNDDARWPDFAGLDLVTRWPEINMRNVSEDGATIGDVFGEQLSQIEVSDDPTLVTLTIGAVDLTSLLLRRVSDEIARHAATDIADAYEIVVDAIRRARPNGMIILTTVRDPSDGTGLLPGTDAASDAVPLDALEIVNTRIREIAAGASWTRLADVHAHFHGHGLSAPEKERWYWRRAPLEPSARGASEVRRVWLGALEASTI